MFEKYFIINLFLESLLAVGLERSFLVGIYLLKVNNKNTRTRCEICLVNNKDTGVFIVNFEHISYLVLVFLLLTLSK